MSRSSVVLAALTEEARSTSELYDRVGYRALMQVGLIPYETFRDELVKLKAAGLADSEVAPDGATLWRRAPGARTS
jgi:hypothetical protein